MPELDETDGDASRRDVAALVAVVLPAAATAVAVAFAATGTGLLLPGAEVDDGAARGIRLGGVALAAVGVLMLVTRWGRAARVPARDLAAVLLAATVAMAGVTAGTFAFSQATLTLPEADPVTTTTERRPTTTTTAERQTTTTTGDSDTEETDGWRIDGPALVAMLVPLVLVVVVVGLLVYALAQVLGLATRSAWQRGGTPVPGEALPLDAAAAQAGLEASLDAVTAGASPRDAISDAYARLLAALAAAGAGRRRHEAPHEHLDRVLTPLGVRSAPLHRLAELFVLARFSQHPVTTAHRDEASEALRAALADLREADVRRNRATPAEAPR